MDHTIKDFRHHCDNTVYDNQKEFTRDDVKALLWWQIANIHNDINGIIYSHMKEQTVNKGEKLRNLDEEEKDIMEYLKKPRCVSF